MEKEIEELNNKISHHRSSVFWLNISMSILIVLAIVSNLLVTSLLDTQINKLASIVQFAVQNNVGELPKEPQKLTFALQNNRLGYIMLATFGAALLSVFGRMKFHLTEMSKAEVNLAGFQKIRASMVEGLSEKAKLTLLDGAFTNGKVTESSLNLPSETISKISDAVIDRVEKTIQGKST